MFEPLNERQLHVESSTTNTNDTQVYVYNGDITNAMLICSRYG